TVISFCDISRRSSTITTTTPTPTTAAAAAAKSLCIHVWRPRRTGRHGHAEPERPGVVCTHDGKPNRAEHAQQPGADARHDDGQPADATNHREQPGSRRPPPGPRNAAQVDGDRKE